MKYLCTVCGYVYDPATGDPDSGIAPGTAFEDIPDSWVCPVCGVGKDSFVPQEQKKNSIHNDQASEVVRKPFSCMNQSPYNVA